MHLTRHKKHICMHSLFSNMLVTSPKIPILKTSKYIQKQPLETYTLAKNHHNTQNIFLCQYNKTEKIFLCQKYTGKKYWAVEMINLEQIKQPE